jgi:uracil-DNA glycosylase family 4
MDAKTYKQQLLDTLYKPYKNKDSCPFGFTDIKNTVLGEGNPDAKLMFVGEAPGRDEDAQARPFVGRSGQLLNRILESNGIHRTDVFITNVVKWRPPNNRQPTIAEMDAGKKMMLLYEIKIIRPKVICTLGSSALHALIDPEAKISQVRGKQIHLDHMILIPTYHPAYILRNNAELEKFMSDIQKSIELSCQDKQD